jgi:hypothetical protein
VLNEQVVGVKTGGAEPAVSVRTLSTFCSRNVRKSEAENDDRLEDWLAGLPRMVETDCQSFFGLDEFDFTVFSQ